MSNNIFCHNCHFVQNSLTIFNVVLIQNSYFIPNIKQKRRLLKFFYGKYQIFWWNLWFYASDQKLLLVTFYVKSYLFLPFLLHLHKIQQLDHDWFSEIIYWYKYICYFCFSIIELLIAYCFYYFQLVFQLLWFSQNI